VMRRPRRGSSLAALLDNLTREIIDDEVRGKLARDLERRARTSARREAHALVRKARHEAARKALEDADGNVKRAARETGIPESTLRMWRNAWGIQPFPDGAEAVARTQAPALTTL
jgi:transcriptional regulator of acetoin/glycerol metabolism